MKTCPICHATAFDDASVCYGCLYDFTQQPFEAKPAPEPPLEAAAETVASPEAPCETCTPPPPKAEARTASKPVADEAKTITLRLAWGTRDVAVGVRLPCQLSVDVADNVPTLHVAGAHEVSIALSGRADGAKENAPRLVMDGNARLAFA